MRCGPGAAPRPRSSPGLPGFLPRMVRIKTCNRARDDPGDRGEVVDPHALVDRVGELEPRRADHHGRDPAGAEQAHVGAVGHAGEPRRGASGGDDLGVRQLLPPVAFAGATEEGKAARASSLRPRGLPRRVRNGAWRARAGHPAAVPAHAADQFLNAAAVARAGAGLTIAPEQVEAAGVGDVIRRLLDEAASEWRRAEWPTKSPRCRRSKRWAPCSKRSPEARPGGALA